MRRLILFVEGEGEADAVPTLVKRLLKEKGERYDILLDDYPFRVGSVDKLVKTYEKPDGFIKSSPITHIKYAKTPTLILHGENDPIDPIGQAQQLYRGLKHYGVTCEFVIYPRAGHGPQEEKHLLDYHQRLCRWFDTYLK